MTVKVKPLAWRTGSDVTMNGERAENWVAMGAKVYPLYGDPQPDETAALRAKLAQMTMDLAEAEALEMQHGEAIKRLTADRDEERKLADDLAEAAERAFFEGFSEGCDGTWVEGDPTPAWKKSEAYAVFTRHAARRKEQKG